MARLRLRPRASYPFAVDGSITVRDINYGNHLGNDSAAGLLHVARTELLRSLGLSEGDLGDGRTGGVIGDLAISFQVEGRMFDAITLEVAVDELEESTVRMHHRIRRVGDGATLLLAEVGLVAFDYVARELGVWPEPFVSALGARFGLEAP